MEHVEKQFETWCRMRDKIASLAPALVESCGKRSEAYQRRYLARRLAIGGQGRKAVTVAFRAVSIYPRILIEEPSRTIATIGLSSVLAALPASLGLKASKRLIKGAKSTPVAAAR